VYVALARLSRSGRAVEVGPAPAGATRNRRTGCVTSGTMSLMTDGDLEDLGAEYRWPDDMPDRCPPSEATPAEGEFYRFVKAHPIDPSDFLRPRDKPHFRREERLAAREGRTLDYCDASALSVVQDPGEIPTMREAVPSMRDRLVARGVLKPEHGMVHRDPIKSSAAEVKSHYNWWVPVGVECVSLFAPWGTE
jgi:hypothetical protein